MSVAILDAILFIKYKMLLLFGCVILLGSLENASCADKRFLLDFESGAGQVKNPQPYMPTSTNLTFLKRKFYLDGNEFRIMGGSIHYFRVPVIYWRHRLELLKALGLNTVTM